MPIAVGGGALALDRAAHVVRAGPHALLDWMGPPSPWPVAPALPLEVAAALFGCTALLACRALLRLGKPEPSYASHVSMGIQTRRNLVLWLLVANLVRCLSMMLVLAMTQDAGLPDGWLPEEWGDKQLDWLRDLVSLLPALVFLSTLSVVVLFWAQLHYTTTMVALPMLQCLIICVNIGCYLMVAAIAVCTFLLKAYEQLHTYMVCIIGVLDLVMAISFLHYGVVVVSELGETARKRLPEKRLMPRVVILTVACPMVLLIRGSCYLIWGTGLGTPAWPADLGLTLVGEWVPSMILLGVLGPLKPSAPRSPIVSVSDSTDSEAPLLQDDSNTRNMNSGAGSGYTWKQLYPEPERQ